MFLLTLQFLVNLVKSVMGTGCLGIPLSIANAGASGG